MLNVQILESEDIIDENDWCRPLQLIIIDGSDTYSFQSCYSGSPENNVKWVKVKNVLGDYWFGKKVKDFNKKNIKFEFVRGEVPQSHIL